LLAPTTNTPRWPATPVDLVDEDDRRPVGSRALELLRRA
jgi:hypothetical protein